MVNGVYLDRFDLIISAQLSLNPSIVIPQKLSNPISEDLLPG